MTVIDAVSGERPGQTVLIDGDRIDVVGPADSIYFIAAEQIDGVPVVYDGMDAPEIGVPSPDAGIARSRVAELKSQSVDFIKIYEMVSPEVFAALVEAADTHGLPIAAHVRLSMRASTAGPQVNSMEHLRNVELDCAGNSDELIATRRERLSAGDESSGMALRTFLHNLQRRNAIAALDEARCAEVLGTLRNTIQVPTARLNALSMFPAFQRDDWAEAFAGLPQAVQEEWSGPSPWVSRDPAQRDLTVAQYTLDMIDRMHKAGVPVGAGTDTPIALAIPGYSLHNELEVLVAAGLTLLEALGAATVQPAKFFSLEEEMGAIAPGMRADLLLLDANPLTDIRNTRTISRVIARGRLMPVH